MAWRWTAWRSFISAFVVFHLAALCLWLVPPCAIKARFQPPFAYYVLPLGLWQWWAVFSPEPAQHSITMSAEVVEHSGMRHIYDFTRTEGMPWWSKFLHYRHAKFASNMAGLEHIEQRKLTARHAVRQLGLGPEAFPMTVTLYLTGAPTPPPGKGEFDPLAPPIIEVLERYEFASLKEVRP